MKFSKQNPVYIEDIEEYNSVFLHANVTLSMFGYNLKEDRVILICHKLLSSLGPRSHRLNGQTSQRETQISENLKSQKSQISKRADAIIQIHHPPTTNNSPKLI